MLNQSKSKISSKNLKIKELEISLEKKLQQLHPKKIDLSLERINKLLYKLGNPQKKIKNVIHVAGTNGKGSVLAFLRALLKASGFSVNTYTSPHLIDFNERINLNGKNISNKSLEILLEECKKKNKEKPITFFEITTAVAFLAFEKKPADFTILETGLGGRLDATNVIKRPAVTALTPISVDHVEFLGSNITKIAMEKSAIMRKGVPTVISDQSPDVNQVIATTASNIEAICQYQGEDWDFRVLESKFNIKTSGRNSCFSLPNIKGPHQLQNAAQAVTCLDNLKKTTFSHHHIEFGLRNAEWPGRLQQLKIGPLVECLAKGWEIWIDGGHLYPEIAWDICNAYHLCNLGGWIMCDDVILNRKGLRDQYASTDSSFVLDYVSQRTGEKVIHFLKREGAQWSANPRKRKYVSLMRREHRESDN